ncbi:MAG: serine/threonine protein kinase [Planctomycetes bacterium]|nr:serine/threonine protein kinase [Planctomycetota bacterium]
MRIPERIGKYRLIAELGAGAMGIVFKAQQDVINRIVAIKLLPEDAERSDPALVKRFRNEALAAAKIVHPNLVTVFGVGKDAGFNYIAMEFVEGNPLDSVIAENRSVADLWAMCIQAAKGIAAAHGVGIIHRDMKPKNVMYDQDGLVKVLDFGIARIGDDAQLTKVGTIMGSPPYMSPEQARGDKVDARTDVFSFGVVMYEVLTGMRPFTAPDARQMILDRQKLKKPAPPVSICKPGIPWYIDRVVSKCLYGDPRERYQTSKEMLDDLLLAQYLLDSNKVSVTALPEACKKAAETSIAIPWKRIGRTCFAALLFFLLGISVMAPHVSVAFLITLLIPLLVLELFKALGLVKRFRDRQTEKELRAKQKKRAAAPSAPSKTGA